MAYSPQIFLHGISAKNDISGNTASATSNSSTVSTKNNKDVFVNPLELKSERYRRQKTNDEINPTLQLKADTNYVNKIKNPIDA